MSVVVSGKWLVASDEGLSVRAAREGDSPILLPGHRKIGTVPDHRPPATSHRPLATTRRRGFTLVELLITVSIIAIIATMVLFAMFAAQEQARVQKTRALITKLNDIVMRKYDEYRTRRVPVTIDPTDPPNVIAKKRLDGLRDLMRMEMPDRWSDVYEPEIAISSTSPTLVRIYRDKFLAVTGLGALGRDASKEEFQGAECLHMIVMAAVQEAGDSRDVFKASDVGDFDGDGFPEFHDAWGMPIEFIRWAPGFQSDLQTPIRATVTSFMGGGQNAQVTVQTPAGQYSRFSTQAGAYVGGAIAKIDKDTGIIDTDHIARITGYSYDPTTRIATFTCTTPSTTQQPAFQEHEPNSSHSESMISNGDTVAIMQPDPFHSRQVYPIYSNGGMNPPMPDVSVPTFATYPLIYSAGPDRGYGVKHENAPVMNVVTPLTYSAVGLNPFYVGIRLDNSDAPQFGLFLGSAPNTGDENGRWYLGCHLDNIHNHALNTR